MIRTVPLSTIRSLFTVHSAMVYAIQVCRELSSSRTRMESSIPLQCGFYIDGWKKLHVPKDKVFRGMSGPKRTKYHLYDQWDWIIKWKELWKHKFWFWIMLNCLRICPVMIIRYRWYRRCWTVQLCFYSGNVQC